MTSLSLYYYQLENYGGIDAVCHKLRAPSTLRDLIISENTISEADAEKLASAVEASDALLDLDLCANRVGDVAAERFMRAANVRALRKLGLSCNSINSIGAEAIASLLKQNTSLERLYLASNFIDNRGACALAAALEENASLQYLSLTDNRIGGDGACALARSLKINKTLVTLNICMNAIDDEGFIMMAETWAESASWKQLYIWCNVFGDDSAHALARFLDRVTVPDKMIDLGNSSIKLPDAFKVASAIQTSQSTLTVEMFNHSNLMTAAMDWRDSRVRVLTFLALATRHATAIAAFARRDGDRAVMCKVLEWLLG